MRFVPTLAALALLAGCTSARVTATLEGEPVCVDFELGAAQTKLKGALQYPVKITVLDGKTTVSERIALGKRTAADPASVLVVQDENETYAVKFAQCANAFAPQPLSAVSEKDPKRRDDRTNYECGDAKVYKEISVEVRKGQPKTRVIPWKAPPESRCVGASEVKP